MLKEKIISELNESYNSHSKIKKIEVKYKNKFKKMNFISKLLNIDSIFFIKNIYENASKINKQIIKKEEHYTSLLKISGNTLDKEQMKAVIMDPDNLLIIAGAGSGKTLTLIAKIKYLIYKGIKENDILCISFTNKASLSLKSKLLNEGINVDVMTFHKLAMKIISDKEKVNVVENEFLEKIIKKNISYKDLKDCLNKTKVVTLNDDNERIKNNQKIEEKLLKESTEFKIFSKTVESFINVFKSSNYNKNMFKKIKNNVKGSELKTIKLCERIYYDYQRELAKNNFMDFNDLIIKAIDNVNKCSLKKYKYIIIDEFQDTSLVRCELIRNIQKKYHSKVVAVGDDWQSIYRFTGCTLEVFLNFDKYFPYSEKVYLNKTYRNSNELLQLSSKFIMKNKSQITKNLLSSKHNISPVKIYYYNNSYQEIIDDVLKNIKEKDILILGRTNNDLEKIKKYISTFNQKKYKINFMTIHKAKGLEANNVILVNLEDGINGFPSKMENNILKYLLPQDGYLYAEERRLFYVAITRTLNNVYLLVPKKNPSIFVKEILKNPYVKIERDVYICPNCGNILIKRKGKYGDFFGCKSYPKCKFIKKCK
jgi:DNA helicase-4